MRDRIREIRINIFKTQVAFANYLDVSIQAISKYETGKAIIPTEKIIKLVNDYNVSPLWLLIGKGEMFNKEDVPTADIETFQEEITRLKIENNLLKDLINRK